MLGTPVAVPARDGENRRSQALEAWERILAHVRQGYPVYDPEHDTALQEQLLAARRHQEEADHSARARLLPTVRRRPAGAKRWGWLPNRFTPRSPALACMSSPRTTTALSLFSPTG